MFGRNKKIIVTHSSKFHTDDIFAVATLLLVLEKAGDSAEIVRTRDLEKIKKADYVVDVGEIYDPENNHFDHHQFIGAGLHDNGVPYASFGLVWKKYGEALCGSKEIFEKIDTGLVQLIDAYDSGFEIFESKIPGLHAVSLFSVISIFNPTWKEEENYDETFNKFVLYAKEILKRYIKTSAEDIEAQSFVIEAYKKAQDRRFIILDEYYPSEDTLSKFPEPLFVAYPISDGSWHLKAIRGDTGTYSRRKDLPKNWAGKRDTELEKITGVNGSVFCHKNLFLAVAKTKEAILKLAELALNSQN